jgi:hypothetical protein
MRRLSMRNAEQQPHLGMLSSMRHSNKLTEWRLAERSASNIWSLSATIACCVGNLLSTRICAVAIRIALVSKQRLCQSRRPGIERLHEGEQHRGACNILPVILSVAIPLPLVLRQVGNTRAVAKQYRCEKRADEDPRVCQEHVWKASPEKHRPPDCNLREIVWKLAEVIKTSPHKLASITWLPLEPVLLEVRCTRAFMLLHRRTVACAPYTCTP